jgi:hypothetical protein
LIIPEDGGMKTTETTVTSLPPELAAELDEALANAFAGRLDPEVMRQACDEQDRVREELRQRVGELNVAVDLIRETRDEA